MSFFFSNTWLPTSHTWQMILLLKKKIIIIKMEYFLCWDTELLDLSTSTLMNSTFPPIPPQANPSTYVLDLSPSDILRNLASTIIPTLLSSSLLSPFHKNSNGINISPSIPTFSSSNLQTSSSFWAKFLKIICFYIHYQDVPFTLTLKLPQPFSVPTIMKISLTWSSIYFYFTISNKHFQNCWPLPPFWYIPFSGLSWHSVFLVFFLILCSSLHFIFSLFFTLLKCWHFLGLRQGSLILILYSLCLISLRQITSNNVYR